MLISRAVPLIFHCDVDVIIGNGVPHDDVQNHLYSHTLTIVVICCKLCNLSVFHTQWSAVIFSLGLIKYRVGKDHRRNKKQKQNIETFSVRSCHWLLKDYFLFSYSVFIVLLFLVYYLCLRLMKPLKYFVFSLLFLSLFVFNFTLAVLLANQSEINLHNYSIYVCVCIYIYIYIYIYTHTWKQCKLRLKSILTILY